MTMWVCVPCKKLLTFSRAMARSIWMTSGVMPATWEVKSGPPSRRAHPQDRECGGDGENSNTLTSSTTAHDAASLKTKRSSAPAWADHHPTSTQTYRVGIYIRTNTRSPPHPSAIILTLNLRLLEGPLAVSLRTAGPEDCLVEDAFATPLLRPHQLLPSTRKAGGSLDGPEARTDCAAMTAKTPWWTPLRAAVPCRRLSPPMIPPGRLPGDAG